VRLTAIAIAIKAKLLFTKTSELLNDLSKWTLSDVAQAVNDARNLTILGSGKLCDTRLLLRYRVFFPAPLAHPVNSSRDRETCEKQVAMIAQKVMNANQT